MKGTTLKPLSKFIGVVVTSALLMSTGVAVTALPVSATENDTSSSSESTDRAPYEYEAAIQRIHDDVNEYRESLGLQPLKYSYNIALNSDSYAERISRGTILTHEKEWWINPIHDVGSPQAAGENLAFTSDAGSETMSASKIFGQFKNSETHNRNLINPKYTDVGYGVRVKGGRFYIVQRFIGYNNTPSRYPADYFLYDNPTDLPEFTLKQGKPELNADSISLGQKLSLQGYSKGTFTHPTDDDESAVRWYGEDYHEDVIEMLFGSYFHENPEGLDNLMWVGNNFNFSKSEPGYQDLVGKKVWAEYYQDSIYAQTPQKITVGPFIVKAEPIENISAPTITGTPELLSTVSAETGEWNHADSYSYQWFKNGEPVDGATSKDFTIPSSFGLNKDLSVEVTAHYKNADSKTVSSSAVTTFDNAPVGHSSASITGSYKVGETLKANVSWDREPSSVEYIWTRDGAPIKGANKKDYTITVADVNKNISVTVIANGKSSVKLAGKTVSSVNMEFVTPPTVTGDSVEGGTLFAGIGKLSPAPDSVTYQWMRDGSPISGATKDKYTLTKSDVGKSISVKITANKSGLALSSTSKATAPVESVVAGKVSVTGKNVEGESLTASVTNIPAKSVVGYSWTVNGTVHYSSQTVKLSSRDVGLTLKLSVKVTTPNGQIQNISGESFKISPKPKPTAPKYVVTGNIKKKFDAQKGKLGNPTGNAYKSYGATVQKFSKGNIYSSSKGTYVLYSSAPITRKYTSLRSETGVLGYPVSDLKCTLKGKGCVQSFSKGALYAKSSKSAPYMVSGAIKTAWNAQKSEKGALGFPKSDAKKMPRNSKATSQTFDGGMIVYSSKTKARVIKGSILKKWQSAGAEKSAMGLPTANEKCGLKDKGCSQKFEKGSIYYSSKSGARFMKTGAIQKAWAKTKYEKGVLGYPTSDINKLKKRSGATYQSFQKGIITHHSKAGARVLKGSFLKKWKALGWEKSKLGLPKGGEYKSKGKTRQNFEKGYMTYTKKQGIKVYYTKKK